MAGIQIHYSLCCNSLLSGENKLAAAALTKNSNIFIPIPVVFWAETSTLASIISFINKLYQQLIKIYLATVKLLEEN